MRESTTYQAILDEGREEGRLVEARAILRRQGRKKLGTASAEVLSRLEAINDLDRLERMSERLLDASSWDELLAVP